MQKINNHKINKLVKVPQNQLQKIMAMKEIYILQQTGKQLNFNEKWVAAGSAAQNFNRKVICIQMQFLEIFFKKCQKAKNQQCCKSSQKQIFCLSNINKQQSNNRNKNLICNPSALLSNSDLDQTYLFMQKIKNEKYPTIFARYHQKKYFFYTKLCCLIECKFKI